MSSIKSTLQDDLTASMKARDEVTTSTLRMLLAAIMNAEVAGSEAVDLTDEQAMAVLQSEAKKRGEAAEVYDANDRVDAAAKERAELAVIQKYLPAAMSDDELGALVDQAIADVAARGVEGPKAMGQVIGHVRKAAGPSAAGDRVAAMVKARLAN